MDDIAMSLIISSRNGGDKLSRVLESIHGEEMGEAKGELILVNSASTDSTSSVMRSFRDRAAFPVTVLDMDQPGQGRAQNRATRIAKGEIIAFTDDDCYLEPGYILKAAKVFGGQKFRYCGGRVLLYDETDTKLTVNYSTRFTFFPAGTCMTAGIIQGCNLVVHREVFEKIGSMNPALGKGARLPGSDIEFVGRASMNGFAGAYVPELVVYHHHGRKDPAEMEKALRRYDVGRGMYYMAMISQGYFRYIRFWAGSSLKPLFLKRNKREAEKLKREVWGATMALFMIVGGRFKTKLDEVPRRL